MLLFNAEEEGRPGAQDRSVVATRSYAEFWKGVDIDRSMLSQALPRLPETAAELRAVAQNLGAPQSSIHLRQDASETTVKRLRLSDYRVVYFATHGLVAGEVKGLAEPSLALTCQSSRARPTTASSPRAKWRSLSSMPDWVVLSACNHHCRRQARRRSLIRPCPRFLYAGARALLVSHWAVESNAATRLLATQAGLSRC